MEGHGNKFGFRGGQKGAAALGVALIVLVVSTAVTVGVVGVSVGEQKAMANQLRFSEARALAEAAVERGIIYLRQNKSVAASTGAGGWMEAGAVKWVSCTTATTSVPCGDGTQNLYGPEWTAYANVPIPNNSVGTSNLAGTISAHFVARAAVSGQPMPGRGIIYVVGLGISADQSGRALVRNAVVFHPFVARRPDAPLIAAGTIGLTGTISVVTNPNGGGTGVPLSAWAGSDVTGGGTMQTCHTGEFLETDATYTTQTDSDGNTVTLCPACECPNDSEQAITYDHSGYVEGIDVLDKEAPNPHDGPNPDTTNFPADVFQYVFGVPSSEFQTIKDKATLLSGCDSLNASSKGLYWVTGTCFIQTTVGTVDDPVILVVENTTFKMNANAAFFGLVFNFAHDGSGGPGGGVTVDMVGGPTLYGAMISNQDIDFGSGSYTARYETTVLDNVAGGGLNSNSDVAEVSGSWQDF